MSRSASDLIESVKKTIHEIDPNALAGRLKEADAPLLIDCREADEFAQGIIEGARTIPRGVLEMRIEAVAGPIVIGQ